MTRSHGEMSFRILIHQQQFAEIYWRMLAEDLLWAAFPNVDPNEWNEELLCRWLERPGMYVVGGYIDGELAGVMLAWPAMDRTLCLEIGVTAFRKYFASAGELCRAALLFLCDNIMPASIMGRIAAPNRHILRMYKSLGFSELGKVPGLMWYTRKQKFVDGIMVLATPASIKKAIGA